MFDYTGRIVQATAGRDKDGVFCVVGEDPARRLLLLADGKRRRDNLLGEKRFQSEYALYAFVKDEVGVISRVSSLLADGGVDLKSIRIDNSREGEGGALRLGFRTLKDYSAARGILEENGYL